MDQYLVPRPLILKTNENMLHDQPRRLLFQLMKSKLDELDQHTAKGFHPSKNEDINISYIEKIKKIINIKILIYIIFLFNYFIIAIYL